VSVPTFIVGTGRCGSTMLSNMLRDHPHVLSLSEFWQVADATRTSEPFSREPMEGRRFWAIVAAITPWFSFALRHGVVFPELLYPYDAPAARFSSQTGIPAILLTTLPHLTEDHDLLFDVLRDEVNTWPTVTIGEHYRHLFGWLTERFNKQPWVERSGVSLGITGKLLVMFPDARFITQGARRALDVGRRRRSRSRGRLQSSG
jgi:Sulfotransferase family